MNIRPLHDRVVVRRMEEERTSAGGIVIPDSATEKPIQGKIIAVGQGKPLDNGQVRALEVKVGDRVLFEPEDRGQVELQGIDYVLLRERDVHAVAASRHSTSGTGLYL